MLFSHLRSSFIPLCFALSEVGHIASGYVPLPEPAVCCFAGLGPRQRKRKLQRLGLQEDGPEVSQETTTASLSEVKENELGSTSQADGQSTSASAKDAASFGDEAEDTGDEAANRSARGLGENNTWSDES